MTGTYEDAVCRYGKGAANPWYAFARSASERLRCCITDDMLDFTEAIQRICHRNRHNFMKLYPQDTRGR